MDVIEPSKPEISAGDLVRRPAMVDVLAGMTYGAKYLWAVPMTVILPTRHADTCTH